MQNSVALRKEKWDLIRKCRAYLEARGDKELNTEEQSEYSAMQKALDEMDARIKRIEDLEDQEKDEDRDDEEQQDDGSGDSVDNTERDDEETNSRSRQSRGRWASENKEYYADNVERENARMRNHRSSKFYRAAFRNWIKTGGKPSREYRDITIGSDSAIALPVELSDQFVFALNNYSFVRKYAYIEKMSQAVSLGVRQYLTIPVASWNGEVTQTDPDTNSTFNQRELSPNLLACIDTISLRTLQAASDAEKYVLDRTNYAMLWAAEQAYMTGSGSGMPLGLFTASSTGIPTSQDYTATVALAKVFTGDDVINSYYQVPQQYTNSPKFCVFLHRTSMGYIRTLKTSTGQYLLQPGLADNRPDTLVGANICMSEAAPQLNAASPQSSQYVLCWADMNFYHIAEVTDGGSQDAPNMQILYERYADTHERGYVFRFWTDAAPVLQPAFVRLKLAAS